MKTILDTHPQQTRTAIRYAPPFALGVHGLVDLSGDAFATGNLLSAVFWGFLVLACAQRGSAWLNACERIGIPAGAAALTIFGGWGAGTGLWTWAQIPRVAPYGDFRLFSLLFCATIFPAAGFLAGTLLMHLQILNHTLQPASEVDQTRRFRAS